MCGIFGYVGQQDSISKVIEGLKRLEYRGYDSSGIAGVEDGQIFLCKEVGKIDALQEKLKNKSVQLKAAIAQTRWATHGEPNVLNAHPHLDEEMSLALVHNGIIENYSILRDSLTLQGINFLSETDTEVVAHLIALNYEGDMLKALAKVSSELKGSYAIALVHRDHPETIFTVSRETPLVLGIGEDEAFVSSDSHALSPYTKKVIFLESNEIAVIKAKNIKVYDLKLQEVNKQVETLSLDIQNAVKGKYEHYTLKEIHEQPETLSRAFQNRLQYEFGTAHFSELDKDKIDFLGVERIVILACGTSLHAGYIAAYMIEEKARIPVQVEISSEYRYKNPIVLPGTLAIAISQSGETADTIAAVRELKAKGAKVLAICNVSASTITRDADATIFLKAGPEIGVCSTKAFTSQLVVLSLLALLIARMRYMSKQEGQEFLNALKALPAQMEQVLDQSHAIRDIALRYAKYDNFFYLGRHYMYPTSLEGALKLKEISYINANGYPAGEMKHGPIALISEECPTVALCGNKSTFEKFLSNLMEIKARKGPIIAIVERDQKIKTIADDVIYIPNTLDELSPILTACAMQLLAYYIAKERKAPIDQPRNLAKSVTVE